MRVISGTARGLKLQSPEGQGTRPTLDNVKEAIFSMIFSYVPDAKVLDLFAGSGAMGIEALSRGAESAVFVDSEPKACSVIDGNLVKSRLGDRALVHCRKSADYLGIAHANGDKFDLIFLDPPYAMGLLDESIRMISDYELLTDGGLIIIEADNGTEIDSLNFTLVKYKKYGRVLVYILEA